MKDEGLKLIVLLRLCPLIPYNMLNYLMGITDISFKDYMIGNLGMLPGCIVYVFIGTTLSSITSDSSKGNKALTLTLFIVGSILGCAGIVWVSIVTKRKLTKEILIQKQKDNRENLIDAHGIADCEDRKVDIE